MKKILLVLSLFLALAVLAACGAPKPKPIGNVGVKLKDDHQAVQFYQNQLKDNPDSVVNLTNLGRAYYNLADYDKAIDAFKHATNVETYPMAVFYLGLSHIAKGDLETGFDILTNFRYTGNADVTEAVRSEAKRLRNSGDVTTEAIAQAMFKAWDEGLQKDRVANTPKK